MNASLRSLLNGVIDYAGLYPPAKLEMSRAVANYLRYVDGPDEWIVSRFVCPTNRLQELIAALDAHPGAIEIPLTVIGHASQDFESWQEGLERDVKAINGFLHGSADRARIEAYEVKIPSHELIEACVSDLGSFEDLDVFVELPWGEQMDDSLTAIAESEWLGAKARAGGLTVDAFPTAPELAEFIRGALSLDVPFKLTAGLHHPFPAIDPASGAKMYGFVNVLAAAGFAISHDMATKEIEDVLLSDSAVEWTFGEEDLSWRNLALTIDQIEDSRTFFESIGSCSVEEALAELATLGLSTGVH